jgi:hypothetical protein
MSDDSDLLIAAAATAAVVTWMGTRRRERAKRRAAHERDWRKLLEATKAGFLRSWRETPGYQFIQGMREALFRKRK